MTNEEIIELLDQIVAKMKKMNTKLDLLLEKLDTHYSDNTSFSQEIELKTIELIEKE